MAWRFRRSVSLGGFKINLSKSGLGVSTGVRGLRFGFSPRKGLYSSVGIPSTGLYSINYLRKKRRSGAGQRTAVQVDRANAPLRSVLVFSIVTFTMGFLIIAFSKDPWASSLPILVGCVLLTIYLLSRKVRLHYGMGKALRRVSKGNTDKAIATLEKLIVKFKKSDHPKEFLAHLYQEKGKFNEAAHLWQDLYDRYGHNLFGFRLAEAYFFLSRFKEAIGILQKLDQESDLKVRIILLLASCFEQLGNYTAAVETYKQAPLQKKTLDDELLAVHYGLAHAYEKTSDRKRALKHYQRVYAADIGYKDVSQRISELGKRSPSIDPETV